MKQLIPKIRFKISLYAIYIGLSLMLFILLVIEFLSKKALENLTDKYINIQQKEVELEQIRKSISNLNLNYKFSSQDIAKFEILDIVEKLSKRFSVQIDGDFQIEQLPIQNRIIKLNISLKKDNLTDEDIAYFLNMINTSYPVYIFIQSLNIQKSLQGANLDASIELKKIFSSP